QPLYGASLWGNVPGECCRKILRATAEGKVYQTEHYNHIQIIEINISISFFSNYSNFSSSSIYF
ncbi:hypothetical protein ACIXIN_21205, partial [Bacteroides fragilis]